MTRNRSALLPIMRSETQARVLAETLLHPEDEASLTDLAARTGSDLAGVHREVERLVASGLLSERRVGRSRLVRSGDSILVEPLTRLLLLSYGPKSVLEHVLAVVPGLGHAYIHGSWAARYEGRPGPDPRDIDLIVVGEPPRSVLYDALDEASRTLRREVNVTVRTTQAWAAASGSFLDTVMDRPVVPLTLSGVPGAPSAGGSEVSS